MKKTIISILAVLVLSFVLAGSAVADGNASPVGSAEYAPDSLMIKINPDVISITSIVPAEDIIRDYGDFLPGTYCVKVPAGYTVMSAIEYFSGIDGVVYAEPNYYVSVATLETPISTVPSSAQPTQTKSHAPFAAVFAGICAVLVLLRKK